ncbi:MAG: Xaa-Pro dipeptidyl-peptidase, partial [Gemmatimonadetes bacterium]|nr:Xaa-Pro dipeptidyl-peptidase [Gemmatimonadota bacterium]
MPRSNVRVRRGLLAPAAALVIAALAAAPQAARAQTRAAPVFVDGQAQVVPAFADTAAWIRQQLWVETEFDTDGDGRKDRVHVDVTRPGPTETEGLKVPVIYETSPYYSGTSGSNPAWFWNVRQEVGAPPPVRGAAPEIPYRTDRPFISGSLIREWVPRGFAVVHSESPGTGRSQGCPTVGGPNESLAPRAVIDWLNGRAKGYTQPVGGEEVKAKWATGKVGMTGTSYNGTLPLAAATTGVKGLEAIIPVSPNTSYYQYYRANGLVRSPGGYLGEDMDVLFDFISSGDTATRAYCRATVRDGDMLKRHDRASGDFNDFWAGRDYWRQLQNVKAAVLLAHGFNDWNVMPLHSVHVYEALRAQGTPVQIYLHQGGHGGPPPPVLMNRWFTRYLYGVQNGVEQDARAWIVREGADRLQPTSYPDYPHPEAAPVTLRPQPGGLGMGVLGLGPAAADVKETLMDNVSFTGSILAQAEWSTHRLLYATPELKEPVHISGTPRVTIRLAATKPAANLSVWLVALPFEQAQQRPGQAQAPVQAAFNVITRGWADPRNHDGLVVGQPLVPGQFYDVSFALEPDDQVIPAGKRIALMIFSSDREYTLWPQPGTELTVALGGTSLVLPVVGG